MDQRSAPEHRPRREAQGELEFGTEIMVFKVLGYLTYLS